MAMVVTVAIGLAVHAEGDRQGAPDPLMFSTFLGGSGTDWPHAIAVGHNGSIYVTGYTTSYDFPTTDGAFQRVSEGNEEVYVACLSHDGKELRWATLVGGSGQDIAWDMAVDPSGRVYVTGVTYSTDFPTTAGAYSRTIDGDSDAFVLCLADGGGSLVYSTLLGGENDEMGYTIGLLDDGSSVVAGHTESVFLPTTLDAYDRGLGGASDAFIARLSADGRELEACTYLGGTYTETEPDMVLDGDGNVWLTGSTTSQDFPVTSGLPNDWDLGRDVFVANLDIDLTTLRRATVIGQEGNDVPRSIELGPERRVVLTGFTTSAEFPDVSNRPGNDNTGLTDGFLLVLSPDLADMEHGWLYGGSDFDVVRTAKYDTRGLLHLVGYTNSTDFPTTLGSYRPYKSGDDHDMFYVQVDPDAGYVTLNSTYIIGEDNGDFGMDLAFDGWGVPIIAGHTRSPDFPTAGDPYDDTHNGAGDVVVLKYVTDEEPPEIFNDSTPGRVEVGTNVTFSVQVDDATGIFEVWLYIVESMHDHLEDTPIMMEGNGTYTATFVVSRTTLGLTYRFTAWDVLGHMSVTEMTTLTLVDTFPPELRSDESMDRGTTGDPFEFRIWTYDNWGVKTVSVEYTIGEREVNTSMSGGGNDHGHRDFNQTIDLAADSLDPIRYRFHLVDSSGNEASTDWMQVPVVDDDPPTVGALDLPALAYPGAWVTVDVPVTDNIGVDDVWVEHFVEMAQVETLPVDGPYGPRVVVDVPVPTGRGDLHITVRAVDAGGNEANASGIVPFRDDTPPDLTIVHDDNTTTGDTFILTWTASDRAGINSMWGYYVFGHGHAIEDYTYFSAATLPTAGVEIDVPSDSTDPLYIILAAKDVYGNENQTAPIIINVMDDDPPWAELHRVLSDPPAWHKIDLYSEPYQDNIGIVGYEWSWSLKDDGERHYIDADGPEMSITMDETGTYVFYLTVHDGAGNEYTASLITEVRDDGSEEPSGFGHLALFMIAVAIGAMALLPVYHYLRGRD
jgi:hypothetical protein